MDSSTTSTPSDSGSDGLADRVAIAALVVSLFAMVVVGLQLAQTILSTARGLPNASERVMGQWAAYKHTIPRLRWFRLEVQYEAPAIFLAHTDNKKGPVADDDKVPIWYADGSQASCKQTRTDEPITEQDNTLPDNKFPAESIRTVNNELATWVILLGAIQKMEKDSRNWELLSWQNAGDRDPKISKDTTLAVGIQSMKRSFDSHPDIKRPYATTTICHLVELAAVLGLYWKEFNRDENRYRAEGNGYSLLGTRLSNFGIVFIFERTGRPKFLANRMIPTCEVKEFCFGNVPTFYRKAGQADETLWGLPFNEQKDLRTLQLGSRKEIAETLNLIGCNKKTSLYYLHEGGKHIHLFPVTFEIIGMLGRTMHITNRCFTYLPNPTIFPWDRQSFSVRRLLKAFSTHLSAELDATSKEGDPIPDQLQTIRAQAENLNNAQNGLPEVLDPKTGFTPQQLNMLHNAIAEVDKIFDPEKFSKIIVLDVLRRHLQEVLLAINTSTRTEEDGGAYSTPSTPMTYRKGSISAVVVGSNISFDDLLRIPLENRETEFMRKYFDEIRPRVISTDSRSHHDPLAADASKAIHKASPQQPQAQEGQSEKESNDESQIPETSARASPPPSQPPPQPHQTALGPLIAKIDRTETILSLASRGRTKTGGSILEAAYELPRNNIWCALVFRMLCWLLLHDFDKKDVQLPKSELMGSRQSVFIM